MHPIESRISVGRDFETWVAGHIPAMWRFAVCLSSLDEADDLLQDALLRAWRKRALFDPGAGSASGWLLAIVADQARQRRRRVRDLRLMPVLAAGGSVSPSESKIDVRRAVDDLPPRQRAALILHYYFDLPLSEVALLMRCSLGTAKSAVHDAKKNLARALGESYAYD